MSESDLVMIGSGLMLFGAVTVMLGYVIGHRAGYRSGYLAGYVLTRRKSRRKSGHGLNNPTARSTLRASST